MEYNRERLRRLIDERCYLTAEDGEEFTLSTGAKSKFYFDCKRITLHGEGLMLIALGLLAEIEKFKAQPTAIGGLTMGADFMTAAVVMASHIYGGALKEGSIVRKAPKEHGTRNMIENDLPKGSKIVVVDDVITSGKSIKKACQEFETAGHEIVGILAVVDREADGKESLQALYPNIPVVSLFKKSEFGKIATTKLERSTEQAAA